MPLSSFCDKECSSLYEVTAYYAKKHPHHTCPVRPERVCLSLHLGPGFESVSTSLCCQCYSQLLSARTGKGIGMYDYSPETPGNENNTRWQEFPSPKTRTPAVCLAVATIPRRVQGLGGVLTACALWPGARHGAVHSRYTDIQCGIPNSCVRVFGIVPRDCTGGAVDLSSGARRSRFHSKLSLPRALDDQRCTRGPHSQSPYLLGFSNSIRARLVLCN